MSSECNRTVFIDTFSSGLEEMKLKSQRNPVKVLRVLSRLGRFSVFEATDNEVIAGTMDYLVKQKYMETENLGFPWSGVKVTAKGEELLRREQ